MRKRSMSAKGAWHEPRKCGVKQGAWFMRRRCGIDHGAWLERRRCGMNLGRRGLSREWHKPREAWCVRRPGRRFWTVLSPLTCCRRRTGTGPGHVVISVDAAADPDSLRGWGIAPRASQSDTSAPAPPTPRAPPSRGKATYGTQWGRSSHTAPCPGGHKPGRTPAGLHTGTRAPGHMHTENFHTGPRRALGPPAGGSGQTPRRSSAVGTAPTGPAGIRGGEAGTVWPRRLGIFLSVGLGERPGVLEPPPHRVSAWRRVGINICQMKQGTVKRQHRPPTLHKSQLSSSRTGCGPRKSTTFLPFLLSEALRGLNPPLSNCNMVPPRAGCIREPCTEEVWPKPWGVA